MLSSYVLNWLALDIRTTVLGNSVVSQAANAIISQLQLYLTKVICLLKSGLTPRDITRKKI